MERNFSSDPHAPRRWSDAGASDYGVFLNIVQSIRKGEIGIDDAFQAGHEHPPGSNSRLIRQQNLELAMRALGTFDTRDREVLMRFYVEEQEAEEICRAMRITPTQFRQIKNRAKARFVELSRHELARGHANETPGSAADRSPAMVSKPSSRVTRVIRMRRDGGQTRGQAVLAHAFDTFGSHEKANHWLRRPNHVFQSRTPLEVIGSDPEAVEIELTRIDHGVYI